MNATDFIINAALLITLSVLSSYFRYQWQKTHTTKDILLGVLYGGFAVIAMSFPMRLAPGAIFDGRSIILSIAGLFENPLVVILAGLIGGAYRIYLGGVGTLTGVGSLLISGVVGLLCKRWLNKRARPVHPGFLLLMGILTHLVLLLWFLTFPRDTFLLILRYVSIPYLTVFPIATMLIGLFMESQEQRTLAEKQLVASEKKYRDLVNSLHEGIWLIDGHQRTTFVNPAMADMLGYTQEELLGRSVLDFIPTKDHRAARRCIEKRRRGVREQYERDFIRKDGSILHAILSVAPMLGDGEGFVGSLAGVLDITRRQEAERKLAEQSRRLEEMVRERTQALESAQAQLLRAEKLAALGELAGSVGHELRNPLTVISNAVYLLRSSLPKSDRKSGEYLRMIEQETQTASRIIADLLDYASLRVTSPDDVDLGTLIEAALDEVEVLCNVEIIKKISSRLPHIQVNNRQVKQILGNLISNACQAMPAGGTLTIIADRSGGRVRLMVADTGVGIPEENMSRLFEPLFTTKPKGIGLGLALSKKLAEMNDIQIDVASQPGKGSQFTLLFPPAK